MHILERNWGGWESFVVQVGGHKQAACVPSQLPPGGLNVERTAQRLLHGGSTGTRIVCADTGRKTTNVRNEDPVVLMLIAKGVGFHSLGPTASVTWSKQAVHVVITTFRCRCDSLSGPDAGRGGVVGDSLVLGVTEDAQACRPAHWQTHHWTDWLLVFGTGGWAAARSRNVSGWSL